ncbi:MAG: lysophospholipid acyltransferase family protein [Candidatus Omnitrophica bacterium]|nr:lysophospholipid acyltransferase family protein [Candidatus Omnitrophota bacterium]
MNEMGRIYFYMEYLLYRIVAFGIRCLPLSYAMCLADGIGLLLFYLLGERTRTTFNNLRQAYGAEKSEREIRKIAIASYQNLVRVAFEFIRIPTIAKNPERYLRVEHWDYVEKALEKKRGVMIIVSHFGNWELMSFAGRINQRPLHAIARATKNPFVYQYIKHLRSLMGTVSIDKEGAVKNTVKLLKNNQIVCMLIDQHERQGGVWVDFFGRKASTTSLPAMMALRHEVSVLFAFYTRSGPGSFVIHLEKPFPVIRTDDRKQDILSNTQQYIRRIEEEIRKSPENWLWMHRRWREQPKTKAQEPSIKSP